MARRGDPCLFIIMLALQERHLYQRRKSNNTCFFKVNDIFLWKVIVRRVYLGEKGKQKN